MSGLSSALALSVCVLLLFCQRGHSWHTAARSTYSLLRSPQKQPPKPEAQERRNWIVSVAICADGSYAASLAEGKVRIIDLKNDGKLSHEFQHEWVGGNRSLAFNRDGRTLAMVSAGSYLRLWDRETRKEGFIDTGGFRVVRCVAFSPDGKSLATGESILIEKDGRFKTEWQVSLWDLETKKIIRSLPKHKPRINDLAFSADGKMLATGDEDGVVRVWKLGTKPGTESKLFESEKSEHPVLSVAFSASGKTLASADALGKQLRIWSVADWTARGEKEGKNLPGGCVDFMPTGETLIVSGGKDGLIRVWDCTKNIELKGFAGHKNWVDSMAVAGQAKLLVSGDLDGRVRIWDLESRAEKKRDDR